MIQLPNNHAGYVVQEFKQHDEGKVAYWKAVTEPKENEEEVRTDLTALQQAEPNKEFRFFGAITQKPKKVSWF